MNYMNFGRISFFKHNTLIFTSFFAVDIMHDVFEEIIKYGLINTPQFIIQIKMIVTLDTFNSRMRHFEYDEFDIRNRSEAIKQDH